MSVVDEQGQTARRQLDGLADVGGALAAATGRTIGQLWQMRNGYAMCSADGLGAIGDWLSRAGEAERDHLRLLRVGLHSDAEVTDTAGSARPVVSQIFCSALPVAYGAYDPVHWAPFARLVLEAAYEATLRAAALQAAGAGSNTVLLTRLGGGAFGNEAAWIEPAVERALCLVRGIDLDVRLVDRRGPDAFAQHLARVFA